MLTRPAGRKHKGQLQPSALSPCLGECSTWLENYA